ncbi:MAG: hypothetical protein JKY53_04710 [Flavobacteriales bacterium]|nr:hypothetical protein [Flavobacteriales bacterium]
MKNKPQYGYHVYMYALYYIDGFSIERRINPTGTIKLSAEKLWVDYYYSEFQESGTILTRWMWNFDALYLHKVWFNSKVDVHVLGGGNFRLGSEFMLASYGSFDALVITKALLDLGGVIGANVTVHPLKQWSLYFQPTYTRYLYRYDKGDDFYEFDNGSTKNLLRLSFGVGYQFGKGKTTD